jgi:superfamily II DNA or RNA helicase
MNYTEFLERKKHSSVDFGINTNFIPDSMFDYQKHVSQYAIKKGRCAVFLDTGLGKTIIELTIAKNYVNETNKSVLIICPLAVAFQFVKEAEKFGIDDISYSKDGKYKTKIVVCNYERLEHFNSSDFDCVILDESSILKNFDGAIKSQVSFYCNSITKRLYRIRDKF